MNFDLDVFISYSHIDNEPLQPTKEHRGWVTQLHQALEKLVAQQLGKTPHIWRDPKLKGNDDFAETLVERLRRVAVIVSVVSPPYLSSTWTRRELMEFCKAVEQQRTVAVDNKKRIFKVLKTRVKLELQSPELQSLIGYEFFKIDPETDRVRPYNGVFGDQAERDFWTKAQDLAEDMCRLLEILKAPDDRPLPLSQGRATVFLAEATDDVKEQREAIRRDLLQNGYTVLPDGVLPRVASELENAVRDDLASCSMSVHTLGGSYGPIPEGAKTSLAEIQNDLAIERGEKDGFWRLLWIPPGLQINDDRQRHFIEHVRMDPRVQHSVDVLETGFEDLRTVIHDTLSSSETPTTRRSSARPPGAAARLYLIYERRDVDAVSPWADFLFDQDVEVIPSLFEGDEGELREYHEENLCDCDGALIFFGAANERWLRRKLNEGRKSPGYGRTKAVPEVTICAIPPKTAEKEHFRTHDAVVVPQWDGLTPDAWRAFISRLKGGEGQWD
jgi:hypothetical protein